MSAVILGLAADGDAETIVEDVECVDTSFPGFAPLLRSLGADIVAEEIQPGVAAERPGTHGSEIK